MYDIRYFKYFHERYFFSFLFIKCFYTFKKNKSNHSNNIQTHYFEQAVVHLHS